MSQYTTRISLDKDKKSRFSKRSARSFLAPRWRKGSSSKKSRRKFGLTKARIERVRKVVFIAASVFFIGLFLAIIGGLWYIQDISKELPSPEEPFGSKNTASVIYDRNGTELYKVFGNENRDPLELPSEDALISDIVPDHVVWAFLAAEDISFFEHPGFDVGGMVNCGIKNIAGKSGCGGSTITQQLVKQTVLTNERRISRKMKELILSVQIEREFTKDQILAMYLTVAPMGSNVYGVNTGARYYFGKSMDELTIAEAAVLASLPQNPTQLSPTISTDPEKSAQLLKARQEYVLNQMLRYKDKINDAVGDEEFITEEKINEAKAQELAYVEPRIDIKAPHFVFFVQQLLQQRNYNNGQPFTLAEIETGGYKITTSLDYEMQQTAEKAVKDKGVGVYGARYGAKNAASITMRPNTGEILAYVGSKDYFGKKDGKDFDPQQDILTSLQQPGSSAKPITYYNAFNQGVVAPGSQLLDIPIQLGSYRPKNSDGRFTGLNSAREHLVDSRNIPAVILVEAVGVTKYIETAKAFGYSTFTDPSNYGASITLGAGDVKAVEHAQAFSVFANGGDLVQYEGILKIENKKGEVIYEHKPEPKPVGNPQAIYLVNDVLRGVPAASPNKYNGDGRQIASKTGTTDSQADTWYAIYTPDFVVVSWLGNNGNKPMRAGAFGSTSVKPWTQEYVNSILGYFPEKTPFKRPGGISNTSICSGSGKDKICIEGNDLVIDGKIPPTYLEKKDFRVCDDQPTHQARDIDEQTGHAITKSFKSYVMPVKSLQKFADAYLGSKGEAFPTEQCNISRSPNDGKPWATISSPANGSSQSGTLNVSFNAFTVTGVVTKAEMFIDGGKVGETTTLPYSGSFSLGSYSTGNHTFRVRVTDSQGNVGESSVSFSIPSAASFTMSVPSTADDSSNPINVSATYSGSGTPSNVQFCVDGSCFSMSGSGSNYTYSWSPAPGNYVVQVKANGGVVSPTKNVTII